MRILLIAPTQKNSNTPRIDTLPEIRAIVGKHPTNLLLDHVTLSSIYKTVEEDQYDIIHFASHFSSDGVWINDTEMLDFESCAQIARTAEAKLVFFNGCDSAGIAAYITRHGVQYSIYTTADLPDRDAWQMPNTFYSLLFRDSNSDFISAYMKADGGEGLYGLSINPHDMLQPNVQRNVEKFMSSLANVRRQITYLYLLQFVQLMLFLYILYRGFNVK